LTLAAQTLRAPASFVRDKRVEVADLSERNGFGGRFPSGKGQSRCILTQEQIQERCKLNAFKGTIVTNIPDPLGPGMIPLLQDVVEDPSLVNACRKIKSCRQLDCVKMERILKNDPQYHTAPHNAIRVRAQALTLAEIEQCSYVR
jgi:hypothetical protein